MRLRRWKRLRSKPSIRLNQKLKPKIETLMFQFLASIFDLILCSVYSSTSSTFSTSSTSSTIAPFSAVPHVFVTTKNFNKLPRGPNLYSSCEASSATIVVVSVSTSTTSSFIWSGHFILQKSPFLNLNFDFLHFLQCNFLPTSVSSLTSPFLMHLSQNKSFRYLKLA